MSDPDDSAWTNASTEALPPITLTEMQRIIRCFSDRMPAPVRAVKVHPLYLDVFIGNLREEGFHKVKPSSVASFNGLPIVTDTDVPYGQYWLVHAGEEAAEGG